MYHRFIQNKWQQIPKSQRLCKTVFIIKEENTHVKITATASDLNSEKFILKSTVVDVHVCHLVKSELMIRATESHCRMGLIAVISLW